MISNETIHTFLSQRAWTLRLATAGVALLLSGCDDSVEPPAATDIVLDPASVSLSYLGETATVAVTVTDQRGQTFQAVVEWSSSAPEVFTVNTSGVVTAVSNGSGTLTAAVPGLAAQATVTVQQAADTVIVIEGGGQRGVQGTALRDSVVVQVRDRGGAAVAGATVEFAPSAGGTADPPSVEADDEGRAATTWTLGDAPGTQSLTASVADEAASSVDATALGPGEAADSIETLSGENRRAAPGHALAVVVRVVNENGEPAPGATVVFAPGTGHGSATPRSAEAGADGLARTEWTPGQVDGPQTLVASIEGGPSSTMQATVVRPRALRLAEGAAEGAAGRPMTMSAQLVDRSGAPVEGLLLFEPARGHGTVDDGGGPASMAAVRTDTTATGSILWTPMGDVAGQPTQTLFVSVPDFPHVPTLAIDLQITSGICSRTPQVVLAILLALFSVDPLTELECADVTLDDLESSPLLSGLTLAGLEITSLQEWDFAGINLLWLDLTNNHLTELPSGVFSGSPNLGILLMGDNRFSASVFAEIRDLRNLEVLDMSRNPLGEIPAGAFDAFAEMQVLLLEDVGVRTVPPNVFRNLSNLTALSLVSNDELRTLEEDAFRGLSALQNLGLSRTGIETIEPGAFNGLSALRLLDIGNNSRLTTLPAGAFQGLSRLVFLPLDTTAVAHIEPGAFEGLDALQLLVIERSKLATLTRGAFRGMPQLQALSLLDNPELTTLPPGAFDGLSPSVQQLEITSGAVSTIEPGAFDGLTTLKYLILDGNRLTAWPADAFRGPAALAGLSLGDNGISELPANAFASQARLQVLRLHDNALAAWPNAALAPLASLESLNLRGNELAGLPSGSFGGLSGSLQHLDLRDNPGAPFTLGLAIERVGGEGEALSEGNEATLRAKALNDVPVPFATDVKWTASGDVVGVPEGMASLAAGAVASEPWTLSGDNNGAAGGAQVSVAANAAFRSDSIFGLKLLLADTLALEFAADSTRTNRRPVAVGSIPEVTIELPDRGATRTVSVEVAPYFSDPDDDSLVYEASPADDEIVEAAVAGGTLTLVSRSPGTTVVQVRAFDPGGFVAVQRMAVTVRGPFDVEIVYLGEVSPEHRTVFEEAAERWESILVQGLPEIDFSQEPVDADQCVEGQPQITDTITDLRIYAAIRPIDGDRNILARAGPCALRDDGTFLPVFGVMEFDEADIPLLESEPGGLRAVVLHEMAHVLGLGTIWSEEYANLLRNPSVDEAGADTHFVGELARAAFDAAGGSDYTAGAKVPVENNGAPGTADGHWRENVLVTELMTPHYDSGSDALSAITIQSLADLGYEVDASRADPYTLPGAHGRAHAVRPCEGDQCVDLSQDIRKGPIVLVGPGGRVTGMVRR